MYPALSFSSPLSSLHPAVPSASAAVLSDGDHVVLTRQMDGIQASLAHLPAGQQQSHLLACLLSTFEQQLQAERRAEQWRQRCEKLQQRLRGLRADIDELLDDGHDGDGQPHTNGKEERRPNGHQPLQQQQQPPQHGRHTTSGGSTTFTQEPLHQADDGTFNGFSDYSTLIAATEARLDVERRQRQTQPQPTALSASATAHSSATLTSSPHYHHDHTLTGAGKQLVRSIVSLVSASGCLDLSQLQRLCERVGRASAAAAASEDDGDVWWVWQSYVSEGDDGEQSIGQADMEQLYEQDWNVDDDAKRLGLI